MDVRAGGREGAGAGVWDGEEVEDGGAPSGDGADDDTESDCI